MKKAFSRPQSLHPTPFHYCPGCGHSIVHRLIADVVDEMKLRDKTICVDGVGCSVVAGVATRGVAVHRLSGGSDLVLVEVGMVHCRE